jgi:acyl carrier protein
MITHTAQPQADGHPGTDSTADRVIAELAAVLDLMHREVVPTADLRADFGAKREDYLLIWRALEHAFSLSIPLHKVDTWHRVSDVVAYLESRTAAERIGA